MEENASVTFIVFANKETAEIVKEFLIELNKKHSVPFNINTKQSWDSVESKKELLKD